jgi:hypothetical protein
MRGSFQLTIGASGESFGRFQEVDGSSGTITGRVVGGRADLILHYGGDAISATGTVTLGPGGATGGGVIPPVYLSVAGEECAGNWQSQ